MTNEARVADEESLTAARQLVAELEAGNEGAAHELLDVLSRKREQGLFQELGKLTRELHDALRNFQIDTRISSLTESDIPDAKERLSYVITMTEQAAHKTLNAVEEGLPIAEDLKARSQELRDKWQRFRSRDMVAEEFRNLVPEIDDFLEVTSDNAVKLNNTLSEVMMAQDFQDLTGQIIRKVINLVTEVEGNLVDLIKISGSHIQAEGRVKAEEKEKSAAEKKEEMSRGFGPQVPGVDDAAGAGEVVNSQDDVDELLSSLGF